MPFKVSFANRLPRCLSPSALAALFVANVAISAGSHLIGDYSVVEEISCMINLLIQFMLITHLLQKQWPGISPAVDRKLDEFSYPIYIAHWQIAFATSMVIYGEPIRGRNIESIIIFSVSMAPLFAVSRLGLRFIDGYTNQLRTKIKNRLGEPVRQPRINPVD